MDKHFQEHDSLAWLSQTEGQLSVDVIENETEIIVRAAIAGVTADELDIQLSEDTITIRGERDHGCEVTSNETIHAEECHWGSFSRSVILPAHVNPDDVNASLKRGILTLRMKKVEMERSIEIDDDGY
ncbi:Hsp20/alpha crystallin family protein [Candidatus Uhrbacteria bacterium]|nr:Hsp20/alpha crystallin family protein [Candidatus Uhrbacteria bacterium]